MKNIILVLGMFIISLNVSALVDFHGVPYAIPHDNGPSCLGNQYFEVGILTNFEINNDKFVIQRSTDPNFSWATIVATLDGCGTCGNRTYSTLDYGPFNPNEIWYYRVKAISNNLNYHYSQLVPVIINEPTVVNWVSQVTHEVSTGSSPNYEGAYSWGVENRDIQGVGISLMPTEIQKVYLELGNNRINFNSQTALPFIQLEVNLNSTGFFPIHSGSAVTNYVWGNSINHFNSLGEHSLKLRFTSQTGTIFYREYRIIVVPKSDEFYVDNYCNTLRVWKSNVQGGGVPIVFSEGFDAYNTRTEQFYRSAGDELINCLHDKGFDLYIINYKLNAQSLVNNAAIFQSAIRYVSNINDDKKVVAMGMSMGGVINRYACAKAEQDGNPLPISKFVTLDAPHQGAVISDTFQNWRKSKLDEEYDAFSEFNLNNAATKELLNYSAWNTTGSIHDNFYNILNSLNGDGYPHLVETVGVSFSNNSSNPASGDWLVINITGVPTYENFHFALTNSERLPGSYLPILNNDPIAVYSPDYFWSHQLSKLRPYSDPTVTIEQLLNPTFIPHASSLDLVNGISKFDITIVPENTSFHDVVPSDIIEPLIQAIIADNVYVQNVVYTNYRSVIARKNIYAGENVTNEQQTGEVIINPPAIVEFIAGEEVHLEVGFNVLAGADFTAKIGLISCDGSQHVQQKATTINTFNTYSYETITSEEGKILSLGADFETLTEFTIFPNPFTDKVSISMQNNLNNMELSIYDELGRLVYEKVLNFENNEAGNIRETLNLGHLSKGVYTITIVNGGDKTVKRIVKTN